MGSSGQATEYCTATKMKHDRISIDPKVMFGKPVIKGTRVPVEHILRKLAGGMKPTEIIEAHPNLTQEDVQAAVGFAADYLAHDDVVYAGDQS